MKRKIIETALICVFFLLGAIGMEVFTADSLPWEISRCVLFINSIGASLFLARDLTKTIDAYVDRKVSEWF